MKKEKNKEIDISALLFGKVPPHSKDLEEGILGAMLLEPSTIITVKELLTESDFYVSEHKIICEAIYRVSENNTVDLRLIGEYLLKSGKLEEVGGLYTLMQLTNKISSLVNVRKYCLIVKQKSIQRRLVEFGGIVLSKAGSEQEDIFDVLHEADSKLKGINYELNDMNITSNATIAMNVIKSFDDKVYNAKNGIKDPNDIYTGMKDWDEINGRLFAGLYVVAGRPAMGKGVHMTELICRMGKNFDIGVINGEMTDEQLLTRIGCNLLGIDNFLFKKNPLYVTKEEQEKVHEAMNEALNLKLHIENSKYIHKIANKIRLWVERYNVKCVLADFLTLFKVHEDLSRYFTETQKVNYILDVFVSLCKELKIPIILYVQMNREILGRHGKKEPNLGDLKQSGSIEELAYQVSFLHRPEYYDEKEIVDENGENIKGLCYQIISKHRDGKIGRIKHKAILECSQMKEWDGNFIQGVNFSTITENPF